MSDPVETLKAMEQEFRERSESIRRDASLTYAACEGNPEAVKGVEAMDAEASRYWMWCEAIRSVLERLEAHKEVLSECNRVNDQRVKELEAEVERLRLITNTPNYAALAEENERLRADRDRFQAIVHAVSPHLDPACLGLTPEIAAEVLRRNEDQCKDQVAKIEAALESAEAALDMHEYREGIEEMVKALKGGE